MKKLVSLILGGIVLSAGFLAAPAHAADIGIEINQVAIRGINPAPEIVENRVYVPLRFLAENLGKNVSWDAQTQSVLINSDHARMVETDQINVFVDNKPLLMSEEMGRPYLKLPGYTMVPLRVIGEALGVAVDWDNNNRIVKVSVGDSVTDKVVQPETLLKPYIPEGPSEEEVVAPPVVSQPVEQPVVSTPVVEENVVEEPQAQGETIFGSSKASLAQMQRFLAQKENEMRVAAARSGREFVPFPENIAALYYQLGQKYNIRGDYALAQALLETGNFQFGNEVLPEQHNYCGLGAIGRPNEVEDLEKLVFSKVDRNKAYLVVGHNGWDYATVAIGVEAHLQHLYSYATLNPLPSGTVLLDGRFAHGNRGKAIVWSDLNGRWAVPGHGYGERISAIAETIQKA